jgi:hypothetical protein
MNFHGERKKSDVYGTENLFSRRNFIKAIPALSGGIAGIANAASGNPLQESSPATNDSQVPCSYSNTKTIHEPARNIPIAAEVDVLVAGGGPSGLSAAVAAARAGATVALVERNICLGGNATAGMMHLMGGMADNDKVHSLLKEIYERLHAKDGMRQINRLKGYTAFDGETLKQVLLEMVEESKVNMRLFTSAVFPIVENKVVKGVYIESKSGRQAILAKVVIDATGDADLAAQSGAPCEKGRESDHQLRPASLLFRLGNIDFQRLFKYREAHPEDFSKGDVLVDMETGIIRLYAFQETCIKAHKAGELDLDLHYIRFEGLIRGDTAVLNNTRMYAIDGTKAEHLTKAVILGYKQIQQLVHVLRKYVWGFENCMVLDVAPNLGIRQTRRIIGEYKYHLKDVEQGTFFEDTLCTNDKTWPLGAEQHSPDGKESMGRIDPDDPKPDHQYLPAECPGFDEPKEKEKFLFANEPDDSLPVMRKNGTFRYHIPYRCLLPQKIENLIVPGRAASASHLAGIYFRSMGNCIMTGQMAGVAAAVAAQSNTIARKADIARMQEILKKQGMRIG